MTAVKTKKQTVLEEPWGSSWSIQGDGGFGLMQNRKSLLKDVLG